MTNMFSNKAGRQITAVAHSQSQEGRQKATGSPALFAVAVAPKRITSKDDFTTYKTAVKRVVLRCVKLI